MSSPSLSKSIVFQTEPLKMPVSYQRWKNQVKDYTINLNLHLQETFNDQNKSIKRKRIQLQKELKYLKKQYYNKRQKIREMEEYFFIRCENVLNNDIRKWEDHQSFFRKMFQHYQYQVEIQNLINEKNNQKIQLLNQQLKQALRDNVKSFVSEHLQSKHRSKSKKFTTKKSQSTKPESKIEKMRTEVSEFFHQNHFHDQDVKFSQNIKQKTQIDQHDQFNLPSVSEKLIRIKTQMSLPSLKKSTYVDPQKIRSGECNFMKPIGTFKKDNKSESILPLIIKLMKQSHQKVKENQVQVDWFEKVVFNNRNFQKIISHLEQELDQASGKTKYNQSTNRVKDIVAKNLFRLKTESTLESVSQKQMQKSKKLLYNLSRNQNSQKLIKSIPSSHQL